MLNAWISFFLPAGEDPSKQERSRRWLGLISLSPWAVTPFDLKSLSRVRPVICIFSPVSCFNESLGEIIVSELMLS